MTDTDLNRALRKMDRAHAAWKRNPGNRRLLEKAQDALRDVYAASARASFKAGFARLLAARS